MAEQEKILLEKVKQSDKNAFHRLFSDFHDTLFRFVAYRVQDGDLAEDITQETFLRVWRTRESIMPKKSFFSVPISAMIISVIWKYAIATRP